MTKHITELRGDYEPDEGEDRTEEAYGWAAERLKGPFESEDELQVAVVELVASWIGTHQGQDYIRETELIGNLVDDFLCEVSE